MSVADRSRERLERPASGAVEGEVEKGLRGFGAAVFHPPRSKFVTPELRVRKGLKGRADQFRVEEVRKKGKTHRNTSALLAFTSTAPDMSVLRRPKSTGLTAVAMKKNWMRQCRATRKGRRRRRKRREEQVRRKRTDPAIQLCVNDGLSVALGQTCGDGDDRDAAIESMRGKLLMGRDGGVLFDGADAERSVETAHDGHLKIHQDDVCGKTQL